MPNLAYEPESRRCPNCAEWINTDAIFCRFCLCGLSPQHFHPCAFCAEMVRMDATRCRYCQSDLPEAKGKQKIDMRPFEPRVIRSSTEAKPVGFNANWELIDERVELICAQFRRDPSPSLDDQHVRTHIRELVNTDPAPLTVMEKGILLQKVLDEIFGFGPLGPLLRDPSVQDIYVFAHDKVHVERTNKGIESTDVSFKDEDHILAVAERIFKGSGAEFIKESLVNSCTLPNGSVVISMLPPSDSKIGEAMLIIRTARAV